MQNGSFSLWSANIVTWRKIVNMQKYANVIREIELRIYLFILFQDQYFAEFFGWENCIRNWRRPVSSARWTHCEDCPWFCAERRMRKIELFHSKAAMENRVYMLFQQLWSIPLSPQEFWRTANATKLDVYADTNSS